MKKNYFKALLLSNALLFSILVSGQSVKENITTYFETGISMKKLPKHLKEFSIKNVDKSTSLKGEVVDIQQELNGIPIFGKTATFLIKDNKITYVTNNFNTTIAGDKISDFSKAKGEKQAFLVFAQSINLKDANSYKFEKEAREEDKSLLKTAKSTFIISKLSYFQKGDEARLGYQFEFTEKNTSNRWLAIVDVNTLEILYSKNTTLYEHSHQADSLFQHNYDDKQSKKTVAYPLNLSKKSNSNFLTNASYNVFALPVEAPSFGNRSIVNEPFDASYAPLGWHNTENPDHEAFRQYTVGNNAVAYSDENSVNGPMEISQFVYGGTNMNFDFPLDVTQPIGTYRDGSITNLFYITNIVHDISYRYGFTESARNFQYNNFDRGGLGEDWVMSEGRDGGGMDNANFMPTSEGMAPVMQMYLFSPTYMNGIFVHTPNNLSNFTTNTKFPADVLQYPLEGITADLALVEPADACTAITNIDNIRDKHVLVQRGNCTFQEKYINLVNTEAGVKGVIYYNPTPEQAIGAYNSGVLGSPEQGAFYSVLIDNAGGLQLKSAIDAGETVNITLKKDLANTPMPDGSLDNGIIIHEYTHGISNRLTGIGEACLDSSQSNEQMGEGWSDFLALLMTMKPTDNRSISRGMGTYAFGQGNDGEGIRLAKFSTDFAINNYTYARTNGMEIPTSFFGIPIGTSPDVHSIGFVWATMLWDLTWDYIDKYGFNHDLTASSTSGNARVLQVVMDGMKLQACNPSFINGRDAILAADEAQTGGDNKCLIWKAFAKRGLGVNAESGGLSGIWMDAESNNPALSDQVEDFTIPDECTLTTSDQVENIKFNIYPNPASKEIFVEGLDVKGNVNVRIFDASGKLIQNTKVNLDAKKSINVSSLTSGVYVIKIEGDSINHSQKLIIKK